MMHSPPLNKKRNRSTEDQECRQGNLTAPAGSQDPDEHSMITTPTPTTIGRGRGSRVTSPITNIVQGEILSQISNLETRLNRLELLEEKIGDLSKRTEIHDEKIDYLSSKVDRIVDLLVGQSQNLNGSVDGCSRRSHVNDELNRDGTSRLEVPPNSRKVNLRNDNEDIENLNGSVDGRTHQPNPSFEGTPHPSVGGASEQVNDERPTPVPRSSGGAFVSMNEIRQEGTSGLPPVRDFNISGGSVERELRHVHFAGNSNANSQNNRQRIQVSYTLPNGREIVEERFIHTSELQNFGNNDHGNTQNTQTVSTNLRTQTINNLRTNSPFSPFRIIGTENATGRGSLSLQDYATNNSGNFNENQPVEVSSTGLQQPWDMNTGIRVTRLVSDWKLNFPQTEKDPDQFLLILMERLDTTGINKDLFVPCLSAIFEGPHRSWYLINKSKWRSWKDFATAFRHNWAVKKDDMDLYSEVGNLTVERGESLAEFTYRARFLFERMTNPPTFQKQIDQIIKKYNPRIALEILGLGIKNYDDFLEFSNVRGDVFKQVVDRKRGRFTRKKVDLNCMKIETSDIEDEIGSIDEEEPSESEETGLNAIESKQHAYNNKSRSQGSKTMVRKRLENNLANFERKSKEIKDTPAQHDYRPKRRFDAPRDWSKILCYNCGQTGHSSRGCTAKRQEVCHVCQQVGHVNENCPTLSGNEKSPQ
ncbi:uncharacterized protein LOC135165092 [Diachasmimorpha longicaudata]|uniref:uncharacterized protein LOC135165092 n=1 Tax=Diachasmimorpha longicaudata TaxID=58733 RepID=UPI0030B8D33F